MKTKEPKRSLYRHIRQVPTWSPSIPRSYKCPHAHHPSPCSHQTSVHMLTVQAHTVTKIHMLTVQAHTVTRQVSTCSPFKPTQSQVSTCSLSKPTQSQVSTCSLSKPTQSQVSTCSLSKPTQSQVSTCSLSKPTQSQVSTCSPSKPTQSKEKYPHAHHWSPHSHQTSVHWLTVQDHSHQISVHLLTIQARTVTEQASTRSPSMPTQSPDKCPHAHRSLAQPARTVSGAVQTVQISQRRGLLFPSSRSRLQQAYHWSISSEHITGAYHCCCSLIYSAIHRSRADSLCYCHTWLWMSD